MKEQISMDYKRLFFMRHGRAIENTDDYEELNYDEFMDFMLKRKDPPLNGFKNIDNVPKDIDIIYHSDSLRTKQTAEIIRNEFNEKPLVDESLKDLLAEVKFSNNIISREEFSKFGRFNGISRKIILERWFKGENVESFEDSYNRVVTLDKILRESPYKNILLITHAWYLRLVFLFYEGKEISHENLQKAPIIRYGETLEYYLNGTLQNAKGIEVYEQIGI